MAEIRKHKSSSGQSPIAAALEAALGASVRPVTPGAPPRPDDDATPASSPASSAATTGQRLRAGSATPVAGAWTTISPERAIALQRARQQEDAASTADDDLA